MSVLRVLSCSGALLAFVPAVPATVASTPSAAAAVMARARLVGIELGPHGVGFEVRPCIARQPIGGGSAGARVALAVWYPTDADDHRAGLDALDYRVLDRPEPAVGALRRSVAESEAATLVASPHVGIVPLTKAQALASLSAAGMAVRNVPWARGRFPAAVILGGPYYLSTTAEVLASHGIVAVAPFRFRDERQQDADRPFSAFMEDALADAEWAISELPTMPGVDAARVAALGHGGGGFQALLLAMRSGKVSALINIDAGNFSTRTNPGQLPFYRPGQVRLPYLYIATADTRAAQDVFDDFLRMQGSDRFEVVLQERALRHHDLSDLGRGVTAIGIRGEAQLQVQASYAVVQQLIVRFLEEVWAPNGRDHARFLAWLRDRAATARYTAISHPATASER
jgi:hypothetical protein